MYVALLPKKATYTIVAQSAESAHALPEMTIQYLETLRTLTRTEFSQEMLFQLIRTTLIQAPYA